MAKSGHFCVQHDTHTLRRRSVCLGVELCLGEPKAEFSKFSNPPRRMNLCLGEPLCLSVTLLCLGIPASPVLVHLFC